jgi:site-specific recombinase XerD
MDQYLAAAGLTKHYSPHCLRHYAASLFMPGDEHNTSNDGPSTLLYAA